MKKSYLIIGIISLMAAAVIFIFASGMRRIYSGILFTIFGLVLISNARQGVKPPGD